jgi:hypothetical protein
MTSFARKTAGLLFVTALAAASPTIAEAAPMTADEFFQAGVELAGDEAHLTALLNTYGKLDAAKQALVLEDAQWSLNNRAYSDMIFDLMAVKPEASAAAEDYFLDMMMAGTEIARLGVLRLSPEEQWQYLAYSRLVVEILTDAEPEMCGTQAANMSPADQVRVSMYGYTAMSVDEVRDLIAITNEAVTAEIEQQPGPTFAQTDIQAALSAVQSALLTDAANQPLLGRIQAAGAIDNVEPADLCRLTVATLNAVENLGEPQRAAAVYGIIAGDM